MSAEAITARTGVTEWLAEPLVPVTFRLESAMGVEVEVEIVIVVVPEVVMVGGLKLAEAPAGRPEAEKPTEPVKEGPGTTVIM